MRYLSTQEARDLGVILEVNRRGLHPRGLALEGTWAKLDHDAPLHPMFLTSDGIARLRELIAFATDAGLAWPEKHVADLFALIEVAEQSPDAGVFKIQDFRDDPEGVYFADLDREDCAKADRFDDLLRTKAEQRRKLLGFVEQPLPDQVAPNGAAVNSTATRTEGN